MKSLKQVDAWLDELGLSDSNDPNILILRSTATELEELATLKMTDNQRFNARNKLNYGIQNAARLIQVQADKADSINNMKRTAATYNGLAAESLGWVDVGLLSEELRKQVAAELEANHGISLADYTPTMRAV